MKFEVEWKFCRSFMMDAKARLDCTFFLLGQATLLSYIKFIVSSSTFSLNSREKKMCSLLLRSKYLPITFDKESSIPQSSQQNREIWIQVERSNAKSAQFSFVFKIFSLLICRNKPIPVPLGAVKSDAVTVKYFNKQCILCYANLHRACGQFTQHVVSCNFLSKVQKLEIFHCSPLSQFEIDYIRC